VAGGALDLFLDRETRRHDDLDVALLRKDQVALFDYLWAWDLHYATPAHALEPWDGRPLASPIHGIWARRSTEADGPRTCEFLLNEERDGEWLFRRNEAVRRPLEEVGDHRDGVPFLRPFMALSSAVAAVLLYRRYREIDDQRLKRWVRMGFVSAFITLAFVLVLVILCARACDDAETVRAGKAWRFEVLGVPVTSWGAAPATLAVASSAPTGAVPGGCVLYLGQANASWWCSTPGRTPTGRTASRSATSSSRSRTPTAASQRASQSTLTGHSERTSFDRLRARCPGSRFALAKRKPAPRRPGRPVFVCYESLPGATWVARIRPLGRARRVFR
jgi:hypothetical protein